VTTGNVIGCQCRVQFVDGFDGDEIGQACLCDAFGDITVGGEDGSLRYHHPARRRDCKRVAEQLVEVDAGRVAYEDVSRSGTDQVRHGAPETSWVVQPIRVVPSEAAAATPAVLQKGGHPHGCVARHGADRIGVKVDRAGLAGRKAGSSGRQEPCIRVACCAALAGQKRITIRHRIGASFFPIDMRCNLSSSR
jgi:hypothetical protein